MPHRRTHMWTAPVLALRIKKCNIHICAKNAPLYFSGIIIASARVEDTSPHDRADARVLHEAHEAVVVVVVLAQTRTRAGATIHFETVQRSREGCDEAVNMDTGPAPFGML